MWYGVQHMVRTFRMSPRRSWPLAIRIPGGDRALTLLLSTRTA
jgi:hypothetical protein